MRRSSESKVVSSMIFVLGTEATLQERRKLLLMTLDGVYIDAREEKHVVAIKPKAAFRPVFRVATTKAGSDVVLIHEEDPDKPNQPRPHGHEADGSSCSWWRRGRPRIKQTLPNFSSPCTPKPSRSARGFMYHRFAD